MNDPPPRSPLADLPRSQRGEACSRQRRLPPASRDSPRRRLVRSGHEAEARGPLRATAAWWRSMSVCSHSLIQRTRSEGRCCGGVQSACLPDARWPSRRRAWGARFMTDGGTASHDVIQEERLLDMKHHGRMPLRSPVIPRDERGDSRPHAPLLPDLPHDRLSWGIPPSAHPPGRVQRPSAFSRMRRKRLSWKTAPRPSSFGVASPCAPRRRSLSSAGPLAD